MKKLAKLSIIALAVSALAACNKEAKVEETAAKPAAEAATQTASTFKTEVEKQSYSIGASFGRYLKENLDQSKTVGVEVNHELVLQGLQEGLKDESKLTEDEIKESLQAYDQLMRQKHEEMAKKDAEEAVKVGETFIAENLKREGVTKTESGLVYEVITAVEGDKPKATDTVKVHYRGTLIDGTEFDSSYSRNEPAVFPLNRVIPGWTEGVQLMSVGSKYKFIIPAELAYGDRQTGSIPANSTLVFEVELISIEDAASEDNAAHAGGDGHKH
jgi:FKBP-type peptidyl-prolyl cis-trans isomerase FkpA